MTRCTEFCNKLSALDLKNGLLPSHDELIAQLQFGKDDKQPGQNLGTWQQVQQHAECEFCQLIIDTISDFAEGEPSSDEPISVFVFPGEQSLRISYPTPLGLRLAFVASHAGQASGPDTARVVEGSEVEVSRIAAWLQACDENHESCSAGTLYDRKGAKEAESGVEPPINTRLKSRFNEQATSNFRLLDLELNALRHAPLDTRLATIREFLLHTINDAIDFVRALGERYLWVDALCLVQDDDDDVMIGVEMMNSIYHGSHFTLVAASRSDAATGLPGCSPTTQRAHPRAPRTVAPGLRMTVLPSIDLLLRRSTYATRAWTLQELVLARRTVIFTAGTVHFRCQTSNWAEGSWAERFPRASRDADDSNLARLPSLHAGARPALWELQKLVEEYTTRTLRRDGDALRAMAGLVRPLAAGMETGLVEGLPAGYLHHFVLWISARGNLRRRREFGSYSWAGWEGAVMWPRENYEWFDEAGERSWKTGNLWRWLRRKRLVKWHAIEETGGERSLDWTFKDGPSRLTMLLREYPEVFPQEMEEADGTGKGESTEGDSEGASGTSSTSSNTENPRTGEKKTVTGELGELQAQDHTSRRLRKRRRQGKHWSMSNSDDDESRDNMTGRFSLTMFNLVNGQAEFDRLVKALPGDAHLSLLALQNWIAQRYWYTRGGSAETSRFGGHIISKLRRRKDLAQHRFRKPTPLKSVVGEGREQTAESSLSASNSASASSEDPSDVPHRQGDELKPASKTSRRSPPYTILKFQTISMQLVLGTAPSHPHPSRTGHGPENSPRGTESPFYRIPGTPLLSTTGQLLGSLHLDNVKLLGPAGSMIEVVLVARCFSPTTGSALPAARSRERPEGLFWVLALDWIDGVAERRGIGQVLASALGAVPRPVVKTVLLG